MISNRQMQGGRKPSIAAAPLAGSERSHKKSVTSEFRELCFLYVLYVFVVYAICFYIGIGIGAHSLFKPRQADYLDGISHLDDISSLGSTR